MSERVGVVWRCSLLSLISMSPTDLVFSSELHSYDKSCIRRWHWGYWSPFFLLQSPSAAHFSHCFHLPGHFISHLQQISDASTCSWGWWVVLLVAGKRREHGPVPQLEVKMMRSPLVWNQWRCSKAAMVKIKAHCTADAVSNISSSLRVLFIGLGSVTH